MKLLTLAVLAIGIGFSQTNDCDTLDNCQEGLKTNRTSSLIHFRMAEIYLKQGSYQDSINEFRQALKGDLDPKWIVASAHLGMGKIYDIATARDRALNEYQLVLRTKDNSRGALDEASKYIETPYSVK
jgi:tetratricopeptide (TPR) repeat protein